MKAGKCQSLLFHYILETVPSTGASDEHYLIILVSRGRQVKFTQRKLISPF